MNPSDPEALLEALELIHADAAKNMKRLIKDVKKSTNDPFDHYSELSKRQLDVASHTKKLHKDVLAIEAQWTKAHSLNEAHRLYNTSIRNFQQNENKQKELQEEVKTLTDDISKGFVF